MADPDRDNLYTTDRSREVYTRESNGTGWFVGIIVALALLAIGYLVFSANTGPGTGTDVDVTTEAPVTEPGTAPAPMTEAPATDAAPAPMTEAPATGTDAAPATEAPATEAPATEAPAAPAEGGAAAPATQ